MPIDAASQSIHLPNGVANEHDVHFMVSSRLAGSNLAPLNAKLGEHQKHLRSLHDRGVLAFAGPFFSTYGENTGNGFYVLKVDSFGEAERLARADPLHAAGVRHFTVEPWLKVVF